MKTNLLALLIALLVSLASHAQTQKGDKMIGGSGYMEFESGFHIGVSPSIGFFIIDDLVVGSGIPISYGYIKEAKYRSISGGIEPYIRYYFGNQAPLRVFAQANGSISFLNGKNKGDAHYGSGYTQNSFGGSLGLVRFISEQVGLEARLYYNNYQNAQTSDSYTTYNSRQDNYGLMLGIQVHIPRSSKE